MPAFPLRRLRDMFFLAGLIVVTGCQPDHSPLKEENERLRDQVAKQEAIVSSIQDGTKFLQEQTTLLTQEAREAKKEAIRLEAERQATAAKLQAQLLENRKLTKDNQLISETKSRSEQSFRVDDKGGQSEEVPQPLAAVCRATEETLGKNGYTLRVSVKTDQKAVYVTDRKLSSPSTLELSGFRNQYLVSIQTLPSNHARVTVRADFEKMGQGGRVLVAGNEEIAEIERRLIGEIRQALAVPGRV
jgi:cell division septum initiation protein DivIVA